MAMPLIRKFHATICYPLVNLYWPLVSAAKLNQRFLYFFSSVASSYSSVKSCVHFVHTLWPLSLIALANWPLIFVKVKVNWMINVYMESIIFFVFYFVHVEYKEGV